MKTLFTGLAIAALAAGTAYAVENGSLRADADSNGTITRAEMQAQAAQRFAQADANKDGKLDTADRTARRAAMFDTVDTDRNGQISRAEFDAHHAARMQGHEGRDGMGKMDGHGQGHRMGRGGHGGRGGMMAGMFDANKDGAVSQAEFTTAAMQRFETMDSNKDGQVTQAEQQAARGAFRERMQQFRGRVPAPAVPAS